MDFLLAFALVIFGLLAGIVGGFLGIGGCVIMLPALYFLFRYPLPLAIGTTITAVIVTAASGSIAHIRMRNVDYGTARIVVSSGAAGSILGSIAFLYLAEEASLLNLILGFAFLYVSLRMIYEGFLKRGMPEKIGGKIPGRAISKALIGFGVGVITGIVGLGGGYALVPSFIYLLGSPVKIAVGTSLPSFISMAVISGGFKIYQGFVDVVAAICLGAGTAIGAQIGARLVPKMPTWIIKAIFGLVFLYVSLKFILIAFGIRI
ncbi:sulfite exporter TauE/SafE family protein [Candidatus Bathyarchaeota archaeon]|nr:MAG: sulfite exporter TauE/SafE family protein [Candidatus Bathyarchaeota archaeon]